MLSVRLPEAELRRYKSLAASRGVSVQTAVHEAMEAWASDKKDSPLESLLALQGSLAEVDVLELLQEDKIDDRRRERERELA